MLSIPNYPRFLGGLCALLISGTAAGGVVYVDVDSPGPTRDGTSWGTAFQAISQGVAAAGAGDEVWVAAGTYVGTVGLKNYVGIYGGFSGSETSRSQRDWVAIPPSSSPAEPSGRCTRR